MRFSLTKEQGIAVGFSVLLALPFAGQLLTPVFQGETSVLVTERRAKAAYPALPNSTDALARYTEEIDAWMQDGFGFREAFVTLYRKLQNELDLNGLGGRVVIGEEGWLFLNGPAIDRQRGLLSWDENRLSAWVTAARALNKLCEARGAAFAVLIAPDKLSIYPEHLPTQFGIDELTDAPERSQIPRLAGELTAQDVTVVNPLDGIRSAKGSARQYYQTDTHWTAEGAFVAYGELMSALNTKGVNAAVLSREALATGQSESFSGDLVALSNLPESTSEHRTVTQPKQRPKIEVKTHEGLTFAGQDAKTMTVVGGEGPRLLLIGDSFANALLPFLQQSFSEITFVHHHALAFDAEVIDRFPADVILLQSVERFLHEPLAPKGL